MQFQIFRSSAGSGKTFTLTKEYLKLALVPPPYPRKFDPNYFRHILAITFTKDASKEMRDRILQALSEFAQLQPGQPHGLFDRLLADIREEAPEFPITAEELIRRAQEVKKAVLHNYSDLSISTIDAFNARLVKSFKKELGLPFQFDIELSTDDLIAKSVDTLLDRVGAEGDEQLNQLLTDLIEAGLEEDKSVRVETALADIAKVLFEEDSAPYVGQIAGVSGEQIVQIRKTLRLYQRGLIDTLRELAQRALDAIHRERLGVEHLAGGKSGLYPYLSKWTKPGADFWELTPEKQYIRKALEEGKWAGSKVPREIQTAIDRIAPELEACLSEMVRVWHGAKGRLGCFQFILKNIHVLGTLSALNKVLEEVKTEMGVVHISEFNQKINSIVEEEPVPFLYERIGSVYNHILIDEFQDTSRMQWHNLIPLVVNSLGGGYGSMVVGDGKQAIYRWRGGRAEMLVRLPEVPTAAPDSGIAREAAIFHQTAQDKRLGRNFRSRDQIIAFNNHFFETTVQQLGADFPELLEHYEGVAQEPSGKPGGEVALFLAEKSQEISTEQATEAVCHLTWQLVDEQLAQGYRYADIAILVRNNKESAEIAQFLVERGIPVVSGEALLLNSSPVVNLLVNLLRVIQFPADPQRKMLILEELARQYLARNRDGLQQFSGEHYQSAAVACGRIVKDSGTPHTQAVAYQAHRLDVFFDWINTHFRTQLNVTFLQTLTVFEMAEEFIRAFGLHEPCPPSETHQAINEQLYLYELLELLRGFSFKKNSNSLVDFLEFWELKSENLSIKLAQTGNAVVVMTAHKSKGLQFPVVILPLADWSTVHHNNSNMWFQLPPDALYEGFGVARGQITSKSLDHSPEMHAQANHEKALKILDEFNLLYVAMTRPEERLLIVCRNKSANSVAGLLKTYIDSLPLEALLTDEFIPIELAPDLPTVNFRKVQLFEDRSQPELTEETLEYPPLMLPAFIHTESRNKVQMRPERTRQNDEELEVDALVQAARKQGILVHKAFEMVRFVPDIPRAVRALVLEGLITEAETAEYIARMEAVADLPLVRPYFAPAPNLRVRNEKEILLGRGTPGSSLRPDRLVYDGQTLAVIDYKTGKADYEKHERQLRGYERELRAIGFQKIRKFLLYTEIPEAIEIA